MLYLNDGADFTWSFGMTFFIKTNKGNYIWSDPEYYGDNTLTKFDGNLYEWYKYEKISYGRHKGIWTIGDYCGPDVTLNGQKLKAYE